MAVLRKALLLLSCFISPTWCMSSEVVNSDAVNSVYATAFIGVVSLVSFVILLICCANFCPRRHSSAKDYETNPDAYFNDVAIGRPPEISFALYPPTESTPSATSMPVYFEPLPDPVKLRKQQPTSENMPGAMANSYRLRPKISSVGHERQQSDNDCDIVDGTTAMKRSSQQEKMRLDKLLAAIHKANAKQAFPRNQLQYIRELGSGWFGKVLQGEGSGILPGHKKTKVIVQMLKDEADQHDQLAFLLEAICYREIDSPNVLKLVGQCIDSNPFLNILEFCPLGDVKSYLRSQRSAVESLDKQGLLLNFACDMAAGLQALHQAGFIHRDFAARNCLINADMIVKVGDYGLAEEMFRDDYYFDFNNDAIPIRWLAPESVQVTGDVVAVRTITKESNLWSFGVALWEVFTCGSLPYGDLPNDQVLRLVVSEHCVHLSRPDLPVSNVDRIHQLMEMCWHTAPGQRASLRELRIMLLHLRSAVRESGDPESTAAFDQKWNQLMPRHVITTAVVESQSLSASDGKTLIPEAVDVDLGTLTGGGGGKHPITFESPEFPSVLVASSSQPVVPSVRSFQEVGNVSSPVNELSLAAELSGAFGTTFVQSDNAEDGMRKPTPQGTPKRHINVHVEVHNENAYAVEYIDPSPSDSSLNVEPATTSLWNEEPESFRPHLGREGLQDSSSEQFSTSKNGSSSVDKYATYLQTVAVMDEFPSISDTEKFSSPLTSGSGDAFKSFAADGAIGDETEFGKYYKTLASEANAVAASEAFLGDGTDFAKFYNEQSTTDQNGTNPFASADNEA